MILLVCFRNRWLVDGSCLIEEVAVISELVLNA